MKKDPKKEKHGLLICSAKIISRSMIQSWKESKQRLRGKGLERGLSRACKTSKNISQHVRIQIDVASKKSFETCGTRTNIWKTQTVLGLSALFSEALLSFGIEISVVDGMGTLIDGMRWSVVAGIIERLICFAINSNFRE
jgi:hypothetical protein